MTEIDEIPDIEKLPRAKGGLVALLRDTSVSPAVASPSTPYREVYLDEIELSPFQPREEIDQTKLEELAASIAKKGVLQPILLREYGETSLDGKRYELIAGERRLRAAKLAGLEKVPAIVTYINDREAAEVAIIENAQREDLNPVEEAIAFKALVEQFGMNQSEIAQAVCKNRATVANALRLLHLPTEVLHLLRKGDLSAGHGRALLGLKDSEQQLRLAERTVSQQLSVRVLEQLVQRANDASEGEAREDEERPNFERQESKIGEALGVERVRLRVDGQGKRQLTITFDTEAAWRRFMGKIK